MLSLTYNTLSDLPFYHLDNASFNLVTYELSHGRINYDNDRLESLIFNPINQYNFNNLFSNYLDPDINFSFSIPNSNYFTEEEVNAEISAEPSNPSFSVLHLNARSLLGNFDNLK